MQTTKFSFEIPNDRTDLIDIANFLVKKAKKFRTKKNSSKSIIDERLEFIAKNRHKLSGNSNEADYGLYRDRKYGN